MGLTFMVGKTDAVDGIHVSTEFFFFVGPLLPTHSMYVTAEDVQRVPGATVFSYSGIKLPLQWKSVLLGYARVWPAWLAVIYPFYRHWGERVVFTPDATWIPPIVMLAIWVFFLVVPGRLSENEKRRRRLLAKAAGLLLDPGQLDRFRRDVAIEELEIKLGKREVPHDVAALEAKVDALEVDDAILAYAYAAYQGVKDASYRPAAARLCTRLLKVG